MDLEARRLIPRPVVAALAALLVGTAVVPAAAADDCLHPAGGVKACDDDNDGRRDTVTVVVDEDGLGSLEVLVEDYSASDGTHRGGHVSAATDEDGPVGARQASAHAGCGGDAGLVPCTDAGLGAGLGDDGTNASTGARCDDAVVGATPACDRVTAAAAAGHGSQDAKASTRCGGVGGLGSPCPLYLRGNLEASTYAGDVALYAWGLPFSASVCEVDAHTDDTCVVLP